METLLYTALSNTIIVAIIVLSNLLLTRVIKNKQILAILWLVALAKLLTPALFNLPIITLPINQANDQIQFNIASIQPTDFDNDKLNTGYKTSITPLMLEKTPLDDAIKLDWHTILISIWLGGGIIFISYNCYKIFNTINLLRKANKPPHFIKQEAEKIADTLGLKSAPRILMLNKPISPCVWGLGKKPTIILPTGFFFSLSRKDQDLILTHEMAHIKRYDHLIRFIEFLALSIYWWNPIAWLICFNVRQSSEICCDNYVLKLFPQQAKTYARVLVQTVEYIANRPVFAFSSGLTREPFINRRIKMLNKNQTDRYSIASLLFIFALVLTLPFSVSIATAEDTNIDELKEKVLNSLEGQDEKVLQSIEMAFNEYQKEAVQEIPNNTDADKSQPDNEQPKETGTKELTKSLYKSIKKRLMSGKDINNGSNETKNDAADSKNVQTFKIGNSTITIATDSDWLNIAQHHINQIDKSKLENLKNEINEKLQNNFKKLNKEMANLIDIDFDEIRFNSEKQREILENAIKLKELITSGNLKEKIFQEKDEVITELHTKMADLEEKYQQLKNDLYGLDQNINKKIEKE